VDYVDTFGNGDVTVSSIAVANDQSRIANLIDTLRSTGRPLPRWFEVHTYSRDILDDLRATDATLSAKVSGAQIHPVAGGRLAAASRP
jgi:hypothetical protein